MGLTAKQFQRMLKVRSVLLRWFKKNGRSFYWRTEDRIPYYVLVSEFMLQQTQASRVSEFLPRFLMLFPTAEKLAIAKSSDVIRAWQGLGYNRRALNLQKAAYAITHDHNNVFPITEEDLLALPGVGLYTARAIQAFAYNKPVSVVDVNIERVISRITKRMKTTSEMLSHDEIHAIDFAILPKRSSRIWHEALMDLGATICTKRNPHCDKCPVAEFCASANKMQTATIVRKTTETIVFNEPKRIWRGRVLKLIASHHRISLTEIADFLSSTYKIKSSLFIEFIEEMLSTLTTEGFCKKDSSGRYSLPE